MRVLFVTTSFPNYPGDPSGHFVQTEARLRACAGDDVTVLAPRPPSWGTSVDGPPLDGVAVDWLPGGGAFGWPGALSRLKDDPLRAVAATRFAVTALFRAYDRGPFDDVIAHFVLPSAWPIALGARGALEVVAHGSDVKLVERLPRACRVALATSLLRRGARFRFVSEDLRTRFARATSADVLARSRVAPCALDVSDAPSRAEARERLGIGDERLAVVVGRLVPSKDPLRAAELAGAHASRVVVVGDGPLLGALRLAAPRATFVGKAPRPVALAWIAAADLLVSASREEGSPTVVREARALGVPVLAVPAGDLEEQSLRDPGISLVRAIRETAA
jgi:glycosyltransferase involved in cell wall biosynthesis